MEILKYHNISSNCAFFFKWVIFLSTRCITPTIGSVTIVQAACVQGTSWVPAVATVQNWCLVCRCVLPTTSVCKANILGGIAVVTGTTTCGQVSIVGPPVVTLPPVTVPPVTVPPATVPPVTIPPVTIPPVTTTRPPVVTLTPIVTVAPPPGPGPVVVPPVTAPPGR